MEKDDEFIVQSYNTKELASRYRITPATFRKWLKRLKPDLGPRIGNYFSPRQVQIIVDRLGAPFLWLWIAVLRVIMDVDDDHQHHQQDDDRQGDKGVKS